MNEINSSLIILSLTNCHVERCSLIINQTIRAKSTNENISIYLVFWIVSLCMLSWKMNRNILSTRNLWQILGAFLPMCRSIHSYSTYGIRLHCQQILSNLICWFKSNTLMFAWTEWRCFLSIFNDCVLWSEYLIAAQNENGLICHQFFFQHYVSNKKNPHLFHLDWHFIIIFCIIKRGYEYINKTLCSFDVIVNVSSYLLRKIFVQFMNHW